MECVVCGKEAEVLDTEYDEAYCERHADEYEVWEGPHQEIARNVEESA